MKKSGMMDWNKIPGMDDKAKIDKSALEAMSDDQLKSFTDT